MRFNPNDHPQIAVDPDTGCWIWTGKLNTARKPYGRVSISGAPVLAHAAFYVVFRGQIKRGQQVHHKCERQSCVNPDHLEPLFPKEHKSRHFHMPDTCPHGHVYPDNAYRDARGALRCRRCSAQRKKRAKASAKTRVVRRCSVCGAEGLPDLFPLIGPTTRECASCGEGRGRLLQVIN